MSVINGEHPTNNARQRLDGAVARLLGICSGLAADGDINDKELAFLSTWLAENREVCEVYPGRDIVKRIADGMATDEDRDDLLLILQKASGNRFSDTGSAAVDSPAIPFDEFAVVELHGKRYCFTGEFDFGTRAKCQETASEHGALCIKEVTRDLDYLVVGGKASDGWKHQNFGRKIEHALKIRDSGRSTPIIISEEQWVEAISQH